MADLATQPVTGAGARGSHAGPGGLRTFVERHGLAAAVALIGAAAIVVAGYLLRHTFVGDAAVYLPYARNAGNGHPFQFNPGEFSSGSTSPLWSLLLGIPYLLSFGLIGAKAFCTGFAVLALGCVLVAARRLSRSWTAAAVASLFVLGTMTFYAVSLYESALVVALGALALIAGDRVQRRWQDDGRVPASVLAPLVAVWAALPLARPDATLLVVAQAAAMFAFAPGPRRRAALVLAAALAVAAIPAALYFGYSLAELGTPSTSSKQRAQALGEGVDRWLGPLYLSGATFRQLFASPWVFGVVPAAAGLALFARRRPTRWVAAYGAIAVVGYLALFTFVTPGYYDTPRYLIPLVPVVAVGVARVLAAARGSRYWLPALAVGLLAVGGSAAAELRDMTHLARSIGITEHEVFEKDVGALINRMARPGDAVLSYEVQMRLFLRPDVSVLSEDGITDAKVAPYQPTRDMTGFLLRYRPRWWIADDNVLTRHFMRDSVLARAYTAFKGDPATRVRTIDGIRFELIATRDRPLAPGFGGWQMLVRLSYPPRAGA